MRGPMPNSHIAWIQHTRFECYSNNKPKPNLRRDGRPGGKREHNNNLRARWAIIWHLYKSEFHIEVLRVACGMWFWTEIKIKKRENEDATQNFFVLLRGQGRVFINLWCASRKHLVLFMEYVPRYFNRLIESNVAIARNTETEREGEGGRGRAFSPFLILRESQVWRRPPFLDTRRWKLPACTWKK